MTTRTLLMLLATLSLMTLCACASRPHDTTPAGAAQRGHLLICGGAVDDDDPVLYRRFVELAGPGATIGVVPTATGVENPGAQAKATLERVALAGQRVVILPLTKDDAANALHDEVASQIRACRGLWFVGGDQNRILAVFRPATGPHPSGPVLDTPAYLATLDVLRAGGVIAGTSAGAAMMCDPMITGGDVREALEHGASWGSGEERKGVGLARGMGYFRLGLIDQHFLERGRLGRLLVAMQATATPRAFGIRENAALEVDLATGVLTSHGEFGVTQVTLDGSQAHAAPMRSAAP